MTNIQKIVLKSLSKKTWKLSSVLITQLTYKADVVYTPLELRELIKALRDKGHPIIASCQKGYKLAKNKNELSDYITCRLAEIKEEMHTLNNMKKGIK